MKLSFERVNIVDYSKCPALEYEAVGLFLYHKDSIRTIFKIPVSKKAVI